MNALILHILGFVQPLNPLQWRSHIRQLRNSDGWVPPMMIIAAIGVLVFSLNGGFGLFGANAFIRGFNIVAVATVLIVATLATVAVFFDSLRNLVRYEAVAVSRPRWWFELARVLWIVLLFSLLLALAATMVAGPQLEFIVYALARIISALFIAFMATSTAGYLTAVTTGRARRGRAFECVEYFYCLSSVIVGVTTLVIWIPARAAWAGPVTVVLCIVAAALMGLVVLTISKRIGQRTTEGKR